MTASVPAAENTLDQRSAPAQARPARLDSVDLVRGIVMVIMALDHVRDFFSDRLFQDPTSMSTTTPALFFTRWITHYCAPTFIFLAGTGAFLSGTRGKSKLELSWFLLTRGLWLAFFEVVWNRAAWMFNWDHLHHGAGVFWAIGWSMVALSLLVFLPTAAVTAFGVLMICFHNMLDGFTDQMVHIPEWLWVILHSPGDATVVGSFTFGTGYCLIPWMGVMAAGYGFGAILLQSRDKRRQEMVLLGIVLILIFVALRASNVYGDARTWSVIMRSNHGMDVAPSFEYTCLSFLNCTKYPPSLLYLLMTLGPAITFLAIFDRPLGRLAKPFIIFGRVPMFFYILHIPLIHGGAVLLDYYRFGWSPQALDGPWAVDPNKVYGDHGKLPGTYGVDLATVYLIWIGVVVLLYPACYWFAKVKQRNRSAWLSYI
jgi:uncharacterized membrane protein